MTPQIASGNPYDAGSAGSGVGAVYTGTEDTYGQTMGAFNSAFSMADQWRKEKAAEAAAKAARLKKDLGDLDFATKGINPEHATYFQTAKKTLNDFVVDAYNRNVDPTNPKFEAEYAKMNGAKKGYEVMRDLSIEHQAQNAKDLATLAADKTGEFNYEKSVAGIRAQTSKPVELVAKDGIQTGLVKNGFNESAAITKRMADPKLQPNESTSIDGQGQVIDHKELGALDTKLGVRPKLLDLAQNEIQSNPQYRDAVMKRFLATDPAYQKSMADRAQRLTQLGHPITAEALFAYPNWETEAYSQDKGGKWTPAAEAYARESGKLNAKNKDDEKKNLFENQRDTQIYIGSPAAYFKGTDGLNHIRNPWSIPIKKYTDVSTHAGKISTTTVPATVTDIIHLGVNNDSGLPLAKVQDSYSVNHPNDTKLGTDAHGYYDEDLNDLLTAKRQAVNPKDWVTSQNSWVQFHKAHKSWDNGVVNAKASGLSEEDPSGYDYVDKEKAIKEAESAQSSEATKEKKENPLVRGFKYVKDILNNSPKVEPAKTDSSPEMIKVRVKTGAGKGKIGSIPKDKFDEALFEKLQ